MYSDPSGKIAILTLLGIAIISGIVSAGANALGQVVFGGATWETIQWGKVVIAGISGFVAGLIPGSGFATIAAQAVVSSLVENGLSAVVFGDEFNFRTVVKDIMLSITIGYAIKGLTHLTSKMTTKIFQKAPNYSQYQYYYRSKGYDYSMQEVYDIIKKHQTNKLVTDEVIKSALEFLLSFSTYPV